MWVFLHNAQARAFYARFGFRLDGEQRPHEASGAIEARMRAPLAG
jgi:RimJ/RimL family protein N-acetyltransferase